MIPDISLILIISAAIFLLIFLAVCLILKATSEVYPVIRRSNKEKFFTDPKTGILHPFSLISTPSEIHLSVIVPAYNEQDRLPPMLDECIEFLETRQTESKNNFKYEIIVVSDGSTDKTVQVAQKYSQKLGCDKFRVLELDCNRGKGGAVRLGMQSARGSLLLFADADGATKFSDLTKLEASITHLLGEDYISAPNQIESLLGIAIGSRAHLETESIAQRTIFRTILMKGFHFLVWLFAVKDIKDTQCGFKLFTRKAASVCFDSLHIERWAFDVELLYIAQYFNIPITEIAVNWTEIEGSKIVPFWTMIQMGIDLGLIWLKYQIGAWKIRVEKID